MNPATPESSTSETTEPTVPDDVRVTTLRTRPTVMMFSAVAVVGIFLLWSQMDIPGTTQNQPGDDSTTPPRGLDSDQSAIEAVISRDREFSQLIVGRWTTDRDGKRDLVVRADGTAEMDVTITSWHRVMFGDQIHFEAKWEIRDGVLAFETTGGKPEAAVQAVSKVYGAARENRILKIDADQMVLKDEDEGEPDHVYTRVKS